MQKIYRIIKKKRNLRRLTVVWVFLVVLELFCPVFGDDPIFADEINLSPTEISASMENKNKFPEGSLSASNNENHLHEQNLCNDECLCHATAIPSQNTVTFKQTITYSEQIPYRYGNPVFNSLPPPLEPPKKS